MDSKFNGTHKSEGKEAPENEQKQLDGKRWRLWLARLDEKKKKKMNKTTNKNRRKETKENQKKRKKMEVQAKATTNDRNKKTCDEET